MDQAINWLLEGDVSIQYLTHSLLLGTDSNFVESLQARIEAEGFGKKYLSCRNQDGHWGRWFYQPKWTCTHYTLSDLKSIGMPDYSKDCREMVIRAFDECMLETGGINFAKTMVQSDVCIDGMILDYASYFCPDEKRIVNLVEFILSKAKPDGGYSWDENAMQSDPHTTICMLEGFLSYRNAGFTCLLDEIHNSEIEAIEYLFSKELFINDDKRFLKLSYPYRYRYDLLRMLDYLALRKYPYDVRLIPALEWLKDKSKTTGYWHLENIHNGNVHFNLEERQKPSRFITLKALHIQKHFQRKQTKSLEKL